MNFIEVSTNKNVLAFYRQKDDNKVIVIINLSKTDSKISVNEDILWDDYKDLFEDEMVTVNKDFEILLESYNYLVLVN